MEKHNSLQFFVLACMIGLILSIGTFSFSALANAVIHPNSFSHFKEDTWIGPVNVSGLSKEQTTQRLAKETAKWTQHNHVQSQFLFEEVQMSSDVFIFDFNTMIETAEQGHRNQMVVTIDEKEWTNHLLELGFLGTEEIIDWIRYRNDLLSHAQQLNPIFEPFYLTTYITRQQTGVSEISEASMPITVSDSSISSWIRKHDTIVIEKGQSFSLQSIFESDPAGLYSEAFKTILASTMYKAVLESPFQIVERQISVNNDFNIQAGFEALVNENNDLVLQNVYGFPLTIKTESLGNQVIVSITGPMLGIEIDINPLKRKILPYRVQIQTIERNTPEKTDRGFEGVEVELSRTVFLYGNKKNVYPVAKDLYFPIHEVQYRHESEPVTPPSSNDISEPPSTQGDGIPPIGNGGNTPTPGTDVPPGGTSTDSDPDTILEEDKKKSTK